ncbi:MAG: hypothetical protein ACR2P4_05105, partial [Gammaproteobacteria bacterium]
MFKTLKAILAVAILAVFGRLFSLPTSAAQGKGGNSGGFNFLRAFCVIFAFGFLTACGGGGGGNSVTPQPQPEYRVAYVSVIMAADSADTLITIAVPEHYRHLTRNGVSVINGGFEGGPAITPGGVATTTTLGSQLGNYSFTLDERWNALQGITVNETVYVANFANERCNSIAFNSLVGTNSSARGYRIRCTNGANMTITTTVSKTEVQIHELCWQDNRRRVFCDLGWDHDANADVWLAFPDQTYRRDNGECQSAPFYAVGNCQSENAVDVGNFAAFVSGLDGNGYRQFGVRHQWKEEDWNAAAMVSHAKGREFLDTWWGRLRFEHSVFDDAAAFAEYESGITSLRQNGFMFADIPISGGRVG